MNGTGPYMGMPGMARDPRWVCPEWHGALYGYARGGMGPLMACPELNEMIETNEMYNIE